PLPQLSTMLPLQHPVAGSGDHRLRSASLQLLRGNAPRFGAGVSSLPISRRKIAPSRATTAADRLSSVHAHVGWPPHPFLQTPSPSDRAALYGGARAQLLAEHSRLHTHTRN